MKELTVIFFSTFKFAATFPLAIMVMKMSFLETLIYTNTGGVAGIIFFTFLSRLLIHLYGKYWPDKLKVKTKKHKIFNTRNRRLVRIKSKYGIPGIAVLNPVILSIPVGTFLMTKYYGRKMMNYVWLVAGQIGWSVIYTVFYMKIYQYLS